VKNKKVLYFFLTNKYLRNDSNDYVLVACLFGYSQ